MSKTCNSCKPSEEWSLSKELAKSNRRMFIIIVVVVCLWVASLAGTIGGFLWYLNQYDFISEEVSIDTVGGGNANYIGQDGDIYNGTNPSEETN